MVNDYSYIEYTYETRDYVTVGNSMVTRNSVLVYSCLFHDNQYYCFHACYKGNLPQPVHLRKFKIHIFQYVCSSNETCVLTDIRKKRNGDKVL